MEMNFRYLPLTGRLPGQSFVDQTERAINELAEHIQEGSVPTEEWQKLINQANNNANQALVNSQQALDIANELNVVWAEVEWARNFTVIDGVLYQKVPTEE